MHFLGVMEDVQVTMRHLESDNINMQHVNYICKMSDKI